MKVVGRLFLIVFVVVVFAGSIAVAETNNLIGKWNLMKGQTISQSVEYREDGSIVFSPSGNIYKYRIINKDLEVTSNKGMTTIYSFKIEDNKLTLIPIAGEFAGKPPLVYNKAVEAPSANQIALPTQAPTKDDSALNILKMRYAKGEITKEQFDQMKKDLK